MHRRFRSPTISTANTTYAGRTAEEGIAIEAISSGSTRAGSDIGSNFVVPL